jgi:hypothetical protein
MKRALSVAYAALAACGGSDKPNLGPETDPTPAQQAAITSAEQSFSQLALANTQGSAAGAAALGLATNSLLLFTPKSGAAVAAPSSVIDPAIVAALGTAPQADCAVVTGSTIAWHQCMQAGYTFDGTISWSAGHVDVSLHMTGAAQGGTFDYTVDGSLTVSPTAIQSDMTTTISATVGANHVSETVRSQVDVTIASACITSGTMTVTATGSGTGAVNSAVEVIWTACHVFRVRNA